MRKGLLLGIVALLLSAVACSSDKDEPAPGRTPASEPVHHPKAPIPRDRDPGAVTAALLRLDACTLIDPAAAHSLLFPATTRPLATGPHTCELSNSSYDQLAVSLGEPSPDRFDQRALLLAGAKAYRARNGCELDVPVSFTTAIVLRATRLSRPSHCDETLQKFGAVLMRALGKPATSGRPLAGWDACTVLRKILGSDQRFAPADYDGGIDKCVIRDDSAPAIDLSYDREPVDRLRYKATTIGGHTVRVNDSTDHCGLAWSQGDSQVVKLPKQVIEVTATHCDQARELAAKAMRILSGPVPDSSVRPQQPLTYRSDEPDVAAAGACVDFRSDSQSTCEPYHPVRAPRGSKSVLRAAQTDPNVTCAIGRDAVRKYFGRTMRPVVVDADSESLRRCAFVEPHHHIVVEVWLDESVLAGGKSIIVAGHSADVSESEAPEAPRLICASLDGDESVNLTVQVQFLNSRGSSDAGTRVAPDKPVPLREFTADILTNWLG